MESVGYFSDGALCRMPDLDSRTALKGAYVTNLPG